MSLRSLSQIAPLAALAVGCATSPQTRVADPAVHHAVVPSEEPRLAEKTEALAPAERPALQDAAAATAPPPPWTATLRLTSIAEADFDDIEGELETSRVGVGLTYRVDLDPGTFLNLKVAYENSEYDFSGGGALGVVDPFDDVSETTLGATYVSLSRNDVSWFGTANLTSGIDEDADFGDGVYFEGGGGFLYPVGEDLKIGLGVFGRTELEEDTDFFPFPLIEWTINERSRVGIVRSSDPSLGYTFDAKDDLQLYLSLKAAQRQYRIDDDAIDDAAFVDEETSLRAGAIWKKPDGGFTGEIFVGSSIRTLSLDIDDDEEADEDLDPAGIFGLAVSFGF